MRYLVLEWKEKPEAAERTARRYLRQVNREQKKMRLRAIAERESLRCMLFMRSALIG